MEIRSFVQALRADLKEETKPAFESPTAELVVYALQLVEDGGSDHDGIRTVIKTRRAKKKQAPN